MRCPTCKKTDTMRPWEGPITLMGVHIVTRADLCASCGEMLFDDAEVGRQEQLIASALVTRGIRKGNEFKLVRTLAGFKATEVAELLGVRPETVSRWERGEIELPRLAAFAVGELYDRPRVTRDKLEAFQRPDDSRSRRP